MDAEVGNFFQYLALFTLAAIALFFLRVIASILLKRRVATALAPGLDVTDRATFFPRLLSLIGINARPTTTLAGLQLRSTFGLMALSWTICVAMVVVAGQMNADTFGIEFALVVLTIIHCVNITIYRIDYDKTDVTLPRWWFGKTTKPWRKLIAVTDKEPWFYTFHFADNTRIKVQKYIVGHDEFIKVARDAIRNT